MIVLSNDCADLEKWGNKFERKIDMCWYEGSKGYAKGLYYPKGGGGASLLSFDSKL